MPSLPPFLRSAVFLTSVVVTVGVVGVRLVGGLQGQELGAYDRLVRLQPDEGRDDRLLVVGIDEKDVQRRREDPIWDQTLAAVLATLLAQNPRVIGVDIGRDLPQGPPEGRQQLLEIVQGDERVIMACLMSSPNFPGVPPPEGTPDERVGFADLPIDPNGLVRRGLLFSVPDRPPVMPAGLHLCNNSELDYDLPSFSTLLAVAYLQEEGVEVGATENLELQLGDQVVPTLRPGFGGYGPEPLPPYQTMLRYRSAQNSVAVVGLEDVLGGRVPPELIRDRVVLIGYTSLMAKDLFLTPYPAAQEFIREMPGVIVHAQLVSQLIALALDGRSLIWALPTVVEWGVIWLWGLAGAALAYRCRRAPLMWLWLGVGTAASWGLAYGAFLGGAWLPVVPATVNAVVTAVAAGAVRQATRQGYTQAIYELMRGQLQAAAEEGDYLGSLVQRAQAIRTGEPIGGKPKGGMDLDNPEMQAILADIRAQAIADFAREQATQPKDTVRNLRQRRWQDLLARSRQARATLLEPRDEA